MQRDGIVKSREWLIPHPQAGTEARQNRGKAPVKPGEQRADMQVVRNIRFALFGPGAGDVFGERAGCLGAPAGQSRRAERAGRWRGSSASARVPIPDKPL